MNFLKSSITFSSNAPRQTHGEICRLLGVTKSTDFEKYLGLPYYLGRNKSHTFDYIKHKVKNHIGGWSN